jgi:hypothetical protein
LNLWWISDTGPSGDQLHSGDLAVSIPVTIDVPASGDVPGGGTFDARGFVPGNPLPTMSAEVRDNGTSVAQGTFFTPNDGHTWGFHFTGVPKNVNLILYVYAQSGNDSGQDKCSIRCVT